MQRGGACGWDPLFDIAFNLIAQDLKEPVKRITSYLFYDFRMLANQAPLPKSTVLTGR
jgi:hypothetical protein